MHTSLTGIWNKELSGKARWNVNDPDLEWHISEMQNRKNTLLVNKKMNFLDFSTVSFYLSRLNEHGLSYRG